MRTRSGTLSTPGATAETVWRQEASGAVYPATPALSSPGVWVSDGVMVTPADNPADGSEEDTVWSGSETGVITPEGDYTVTGVVDQIPTGTKDGANKTFTLSASPASISLCYVELRGTLLTPTTDFTLSTTTLTLTAGTTAPASTDSFRVTYFT